MLQGMTHGEKMAKTEATECFSLYDISAIVYTKSTQRIILPMIAELYNLIIAIEQREITHEAFANLETTAEALAKATEELGCVARRLAEESGDEVLETEVVSAAQTLLISGKNILLGVQKLLIQPDACSSIEELAVSAKRILVGTIKRSLHFLYYNASCYKDVSILHFLQKDGSHWQQVLQAQDDATIRRIIQAAHWLLDCLLMLDSAEDVSTVLSAFRPFSEALLLLTNLTERLLWDLKESLHQKHLAQTLQILKNSVAMLFTAKVSHLQYPHEQQMNLSKNYIFNLAKSNVRKLIYLLQSNIGRTKKLHERYGLFSQHLHQFLGLITGPQPTDLYEDKLSLLVEVLIFYCMLFADSSRATLKQELIQLCHHLLKFRKVIAMNVSTFDGFPKENIKEECFAMKTKLERLNQVVRSAVIYQILDNLADIKGPMKRLIEAAAEPCSHVGKGSLLRKLKPLITTFFSHSTQMLKAANLILVTCTEREIVEDIEQCIDQFNRLLATVPALLSEISLFPGNSDVSKKLNFLSQIWSSTAESLMICLDKVLDLHEFLDVSIQEMMRHKEASEKALDMQHFEHFFWHTARLCRQATQIAEFISRHVDKARDPIFRNGLLVLIKQLKNAVQRTEITINWCMARMTSPQAKEEYSERAKELVEFACNVQKGLDECNQPDILSPLRNGVRNFNISRDFPNVLASQDPIEFSTQSVIKQSSPDNSESLVESLDKFIPAFCPSEFPRRSILFLEDAVGRVDLHPLISELITAIRIHDAIRLNGICADLLELANCCIEAAKEGLRIVGSPISDKLLHYKEIVALIPPFIGLAREVEANLVLNSEQLLQTAILLSEKIDETKHSLTFVVSSWYRLAKQLICFMPPSNSHDNIQNLDESMEILETVVQLIGKVIHPDSRNLLPEHPSLQEIFLRVQTKFTCLQARTKHLLEKALDINKSHLDLAKQESFDANCILWSVTIQALLNIVDQFIGRDVLALGELQTKMKYRLGLQSALAAVSENSLRIQEAAKLSFLLCAGQGIEYEIPSQTEQIKILTESLLQTANALAVSPIAAPNLLVSFELLQRKLAITAKAVLLQLNGLNGEYLSSIQNVVRLSQLIPHGTGSNSDLTQRETFGRKAAFLKANIQMVDKVIRDALEEPSNFRDLKENLLATAGNLLLLTDEIMGRAGQFHSQLDQEHHLVDSLLYEWSAKAGYLVRQLQSTKGISETVLQVVRRCLQNDEHIYSSQPSSLKEEDCTWLQNVSSPEHKAIKTGERFFSASNKLIMNWEDLPSSFQPGHSECSLRASPTSSLGDLEKHGCPISQITEKMRIQVSYMAQFLKRKGPIMTKEQVIAAAIQVISGGEALVKFAGIIAKNCLDERCATELLCALEKTETINYQLSIITRVIASTGSCRSSAEHLVNNAQNLIQGVLQMFVAAEAACVKGLQHPSPDSEESNIAAFCSQWRKSLCWHGAKERLHSGKDELGLHRTGLWSSPLSPL